MLNVEDKLAKVFKIYRHEIFFIPSFLMLFNSYSTIRVVYELFSESYFNSPNLPGILLLFPTSRIWPNTLLVGNQWDGRIPHNRPEPVYAIVIILHTPSFKSVWNCSEQEPYKYKKSQQFA